MSTTWAEIPSAANNSCGLYCFGHHYSSSNDGNHPCPDGYAAFSDGKRGAILINHYAGFPGHSDIINPLKLYKLLLRLISIALSVGSTIVNSGKARSAATSSNGMCVPPLKAAITPGSDPPNDIRFRRSRQKMKIWSLARRARNGANVWQKGIFPTADKPACDFRPYSLLNPCS